MRGGGGGGGVMLWWSDRRKEEVGLNGQLSKRLGWLLRASSQVKVKVFIVYLVVYCLPRLPVLIETCLKWR